MNMNFDGFWNSKKLEPMVHYHNFYDLFVQFVSGTPIKRKGWGGYWKYVNGQILIYTKEDEVIRLQDCDDILFTLSHLNQYDWEVATKHNCAIEVK